MADDVVLEKAASIERCLQRVVEEYDGHEGELAENYTRQDALLLNLLRACETSIDLAMHVVRTHRLGVPQNSRHAFELLCEGGFLSADLAAAIKRMVGFRNIAIHNYRELDLEIIRSIVTERLDNFRRFTAAMIRNEQ
ncbi:type VII toxin-antitoxin system HepT family RNase toxin [Arhodomonas sp. SL1]|uniref:type VII toxin-antitoxin system HepT family RNase toxin n=1 Tax=Arhodomonas sp. SL1 TaxID=3425691 RepID=UPI003F88082E